MKIIIYILLAFLVACGSSRRGPRLYKYKPRKGEQFFGLGQDLNGVGAFKDAAGVIYLGKFKIGNKDGYFKVIYPDGNYAFKFYKYRYAYSKSSKVPGILIYDGKAYSSQSYNDHSEHFYDLEQMGAYNFSESKKKSNITVISKKNDGLNNKSKDGDIEAYYTGAGHYFRIIKEDEKKGLYGQYQDIFDRKFYGYFNEDSFDLKDKFVHSIYSKDYGIEFSKVIYKDSVYEGETQNKTPHGYGLLTDKSGNKIYGWFENGKANGSAIYKEKKGNVYYGFYKDGKKHGAFLLAHRGNAFIVKSDQEKLNQSVAKLNQIFKPLEDWYQKKTQEKPSRLRGISDVYEDLGGTKYLYTKMGQLNYYNPSKSQYKTWLGSLSPFLGQQEYQFQLEDFGLYHGDQTTSYTNYKATYPHHFFYYQNDNLISEFKRQSYYKDKRCGKKVLGTTFYPDNCEKPKVYGSAKGSLIHDFQLKDGEIYSGYRALYEIDSYSGYNGPFINDKAQGYGISFYRKRQGEFKDGKLNDFACELKNKNTACGQFKAGKREGYFYVLDPNYLIEYGKFKDDKAQGRFSLENGYYNQYGYTYYKDGKKHGSEKYYNSDKSLRYSVTYQEGKKQGDGLCYDYKTKSAESCLFKDNKRVDEKYVKKMAKIEAERKAREEKERRERERRNREWQRELARRRAEKRRIKRQNSIMIQQTVNNSINSIKQIGGNRKFNKPTYNYNRNRAGSNRPVRSGNYKKTSSSTKSSTSSNSSSNTSSSSGSVITLTSKKPYKRCIHKGSFRHMTFQAAYDCNRKAETFPKAQESVNNSIEIERKRYEKQQELARKIEEDKRARDAKNDAACRLYAAKTGNFCSSACSPQRFDTSNCKVISQ